MKKVKTALLVILALALVLAACSGAGSGSNSTNTEATEDQTVDTSGEKVQLTYWVHQNDAFVSANKKLVSDFEKENPDIKIKMEVFPYDDFVQKIRTAYIGNSAPDVAQVFGTWVTPLARAGLLAEIPGGDDLLHKYYDAAVGAYKVDGKLFGVPREFNLGNGGILVNRDMMKEAGVSAPKTWDELLEVAKKMTKYDSNGQITVRGFDFMSYDSLTFLFLSMILQQNGDYWTDDDLIKLTTPEAAKAIETMKELITVHKVTDTNLFAGDLSIFDYFFKGQVAMDFDGPWVIAAGKATYGEDAVNLDYVPMPSFTSNPPYFAAESGWGEIISAKSKNIEAAAKFVRFVSTTENNTYWNTQTGTLPAAEEQLTEQFRADNAIMKPSFDAMKYGKWIGPMESTDYFKKVFSDGFIAVVKGASTEDTLKKMEDDINQSILKARK